MDELKKSLPQLQQLHKKACGKRKSTQNKEELQKRYEDIRMLKRHADEVHELIEGTNANMEDVSFSGSCDPHASLLGLREAGRADPDTKRLLNDEEQAELAKMRGRDQEIDRKVGEIGGIVERMVPIAQQIGITAEQQKAQADALADSVDKNQKEIVRQTEVTKELIKYEKNTTLCCQLVLGMLLLCVVGFIFHQLNLG